MKKSAIFLMLSSMLAWGAVQAQTPDAAVIAPSTPDALVEAATPAAADNRVAKENFYDWVSSFEKQFQQSMGVAAGGKAFYSGQAAVKGRLLDPNFGKQLAMAYEQAMFDMRADFVMQHYGRLTAEAVRSIYEDSSSNKDEFPAVELAKAADEGGNRLGQLLDKALTVLDKKLDNELIEQGVPAETVARSSIEQKKTLYKNNLHKSITKRAFSSMQGLVPVQTRIFTEETDNGTLVTLGVIAVRSEKTQQFARDISRKQPTLVTGTPRNLDDLLPSSPEGYLDEIGLRFSYDEQGRPMLLAYGRSSVAISPGWSPSRTFQARQNATDQARALAESSIIEFMNTSIQVDQKDEVGAVEEEQLTRLTHFEAGNQTDIQDVRQDVSEAISTHTRTVRSMAQGDLRGTSVVKRWEQQDENNVVHVGTVVAWTYSQLDNANAIDALNRSPSGGAATPQGNVIGQSRSSRVVNDRSDF